MLNLLEFRVQGEIYNNEILYMGITQIDSYWKFINIDCLSNIDVPPHNFRKLLTNWIPQKLIILQRAAH